MSKATDKLIRLVQKKAGEQYSVGEAHQLLQQGADIKALTKTGSMIDSVIAEEKRHRSIGSPKADNCLHLIQLLKKSACDQLNEQVFSIGGGDINEMQQLVQLKASCYQAETFGPLGLLGSLVNQDKIPIRIEVVQFLVEYEPNGECGLTIVDTQQQTCLSLAKKNPKCPKDVIDYLQRQFDMIFNQIPFTKPHINPNEAIGWISRGANMEATDKNRNTILSNAVMANNLELTRALVSAGSNTAHRNNEGLTPLQIAKKAIPRNPPLIAILEEQGVNVELKRLIETKKSHLTTDEVHTCLDNGANINATIANNDSLLQLLIANDGTPEMITAFVNDFNANISTININGFRPIETCIMLDKDPFVRLLAFLKLPKMTTDLFTNSKLNKTLLQFAIDQNRPGAAKLIQHELNFRLWNCVAHANTKEENNKTIINELKQLINSGAQINYKHQDSMYQKWTVLHFACKTATKLLVQYMIEHLKADYTLKNHSGDYPISIAAEYGHLAIVEYLHGLPNSSLNVFNKDQQTPLHLATKNHHLLVVRYLVKWGADYQAQNLSKQTPLNIARANMSNSKEEEMSDRKLIQFLEQLICPPVDSSVKQIASSRKPNYDIDTCELVAPVDINPIQMITEDAEGALGKLSKGILAGTPNNNLHDAAKHGAIFAAQQAIAQGADIRHRKGGRTPYEVAQMSAQEYTIKLNAPSLNLEKRSHVQNMLVGCQQIADIIRKIAQEKLVAAISQSDAGLVVAYHLSGAPLTADLLHRACNASDNVEIVDYLLNQSMDIYQAMINNAWPDSLYRTAKKNKFNKVATYLKYRLSMECTKAIKENNLELVNKLVRNGASVDMHNTNNIQEALEHQNAKMIQLLCQNGAKMPSEWLTAKHIVLPPAVSEQLKPETSFHINRCLIGRRLRFAAASGDLDGVIQCQRLNVDMNSANCRGSTALLCTIQYGNYFPIVHALVSRGASMLHSNEDEPMSLIDLATKKNYKQIADYLTKELNLQFLSAILNNDQKSAEKFAQLGADFNYQDEQRRTALHYAVQYHGIELVTWLCECGSVPTMSDINNDYPIILATEKGNRVSNFDEKVLNEEVFTRWILDSIAVDNLS
ncbi:unnamed protein product [Rotaria socialis]|uniref:Uncharacterized protein n=1 Tax=Rotaria socialis TaxID=392032 RepID=A0A818CWR3_9BILA|nr:unnamed protein product [Rotaria socialis]CAF3304861.1 unnamed protein product [Rotaria socialis]CAF3427978.1 unnamed protein product [Rotaria socialis]CAF3727261.1 unnamed protein product [Rotaria socialis]CAF3769759.1 unnamed protein product [Rotaria socialis]